MEILHSKKVCVGWFFLFCHNYPILLAQTWKPFRNLHLEEQKNLQKMVRFIFYTLQHTILQVSQKRIVKTISITIKIAPFQSTLHCSLCSKLFMLHKRVLSIFKFAECSRIALFFICKELPTVTFHNLKKLYNPKLKNSIYNPLKNSKQ